MSPLLPLRPQLLLLFAVAAAAVVAVLAAAVMADCFSPFFLMIFAQLLQCCGTAATAR